MSHYLPLLGVVLLILGFALKLNPMLVATAAALASGLLGGMAALPTTEWGAKKLSRAQVLKAAPVATKWQHVGEVRHVFTHFALSLDVYETRAQPEGEGWWAGASALPTVFKKAAALGSAP